MRQEIEEKAGRIQPYLDRCARLCGPQTFMKLLSAFATNFGEKYWVISGRHQRQCLQKLPESLAQMALDFWLQAKYGKDCHVYVETPAANGYVDLRVEYMGDIYLVELKVLDSTRSIGWAKEGLTQLDQYMEANGCNESYLLVFDCRATNKGDELKPIENREDGRIAHVIWQRIIWPK